MGISKGYVCEHSCHPLAHSSPSLKASILIDNYGQACLAGFGHLTIVVDRDAVAPGTSPWMSPELLDPEAFGLTDSRPTRESDSFALGMVIYEVLSGQTPFDPCQSIFIIARKVLDGERPERPKGARGGWFTSEIWTMLMHCWEHRPAGRPSSKDILRILEGAKSPSSLPGPSTDMDGEWDPDVVSSSSGTFSLFRSRFKVHLHLSGVKS